MALVEIEFRGKRKGIFENPQEFPLSKDDTVIVRADRGEDIGKVTLIGQEWNDFLLENKGEEECEPILRKAIYEDFEKSKENRVAEKEAREFFMGEVERIELEMKLVDIEYQFDKKKLTFYFTADGRVDFRELVKVLAQHFHTRIDLRQIGSRDESKRLSGLGLCGRELCCGTHIREFRPVTTLMLKEQYLLLNPQKNTGLCGKLRCCLRYEVEQYAEANSLFPKQETKVRGPRGRGMIDKVNLYKRTLIIHWEDGSYIPYTSDQINNNTNWDVEKREEFELLEFKLDPTIARDEPKEGEAFKITSSVKSKGETSGQNKADKRPRQSAPKSRLVESKPIQKPAHKPVSNKTVERKQPDPKRKQTTIQKSTPAAKSSLVKSTPIRIIKPIPVPTRIESLSKPVKTESIEKPSKDNQVTKQSSQPIELIRPTRMRSSKPSDKNNVEQNNRKIPIEIKPIPTPPISKVIKPVTPPSQSSEETKNDSEILGKGQPVPKKTDDNDQPKPRSPFPDGNKRRRR
jgi:cell fate regulator YaaT (PSP1 superfamily)